MSYFRDTEYIPPQEGSGAYTTMPKFKKKNKRKSKKMPSFLSMHEDEIWRMNKAGSGPTDIAKQLVAQNGLNENAITAKQVSNWLQCHKKAHNGKTRPVSLVNRNLRANAGDN